MPKVQMPQLGESVAEGTIGKWLKQPGDHVDKYEALVEVITDKVNAEVPSPFAGTLTEILVQEGETVPNNTDIAVIEGAGEDAAAADAPSAPATDAAEPAASPPAPAATGGFGPAGSDERPDRATRAVHRAARCAARRPARGPARRGADAGSGHVRRRGTNDDQHQRRQQRRQRQHLQRPDHARRSPPGARARPRSRARRRIRAQWPSHTR